MVVQRRKRSGRGRTVLFVTAGVILIGAIVGTVFLVIREADSGPDAITWSEDLPDIPDTSPTGLSDQADSGKWLWDPAGANRGRGTGLGSLWEDVDASSHGSGIDAGALTTPERR